MRPIYPLVLRFVFFAGFAAVLRVPGLEGADADLSLLRVSKLAFSPWMVGVIGAAGVLTALVPGSMLLLTASTILARNVYREVVPGADDRAVAFVARALVPVVALVAIFLTGLPRFQKQVTMGFQRVEELLGDPLPPSALEYEQWWRGGHVKHGRIDANWQDQVQQRAWEDVGWTVDELDLLLKNVTFRRK